MALSIVMLAYPQMTQLDLTAPYEVFARLPGAKVDLVWKTPGPITDSSGLRLLPSATFADVSVCDVLFVPGGPGQLALMEDAETLAFLRDMASRAQYVTSVCTGSLVLAAAGLLSGYRATCHWLSLEQLALFGAEPVSERVVVDRNRITGAGVTSGIDFALQMAEIIAGGAEARRIGLSIEYDPAPPFEPLKDTDPALVAAVRERTAAFQRRRTEVARKVADQMGIVASAARPSASHRHGQPEPTSAQGSAMKLYRYLTGPDDAAFCKRVSAALNKGWQLHGAPTLTFDPVKGRVICGQAIVKDAAGEWSDDVVLSDH